MFFALPAFRLKRHYKRPWLSVFPVLNFTGTEIKRRQAWTKSLLLLRLQYNSNEVGNGVVLSCSKFKSRKTRWPRIYALPVFCCFVTRKHHRTSDGVLASFAHYYHSQAYVLSCLRLRKNRFRKQLCGAVPSAVLQYDALKNRAYSTAKRQELNAMMVLLLTLVQIKKSRV
jgi:hypothetical protein